MRGLCAAMLIGLAGCHTYKLDVDGRVVQRASQPIDVQRGDQPIDLPRGEPEKTSRSVPRTRIGPPVVDGQVIQASEVVPVTVEKEPADTPKKTNTTMLDRLTQHTKNLPGGDVADFKLEVGMTPAQKETAIRKQF